MRFSTRSRYGLRFLMRLAEVEPGHLLKLGNIARQEHISPGYLEQIVRALKPAGIINSIRGSGGGYRLGKPAWEINLEDVFEHLEGDLAPIDCLAPGKDCGNKLSCGTRAFWRELEENTRMFLRARTLADLAAKDGHPVSYGNTHPDYQP